MEPPTDVPTDIPADVPTDVAALRGELARLRTLVGPDERSYDELRDDRDGAVAAARDAEREVGRLRGQIAEMQVQLVRARQDQERYQRMFDRYRGLRERASAVKRRLRRRLGR